MVDAGSGCALNNKRLEEAYEQIEAMESNNYLNASDRNIMKKVVGVIKMDELQH